MSRKRRRAAVGQTWFNILPTEICTQIAKALPESSAIEVHDNGVPIYDPKGLYLAQISPSLSAAVAAAKDNKLTVLSQSVREVVPWTPIFLQHVRDLTFENDHEGYLTGRQRRRNIRLLAAPLLRRAQIFDDPQVLRALSASLSLRVLAITVLSYGPSQPLLRTLVTLSIETLELHCREEDPELCVFQRMAKAEPTPPPLAHCCPRLTSFQTFCFRHEEDYGLLTSPVDPFWALWSTFPAITDVAVYMKPPDELIPKLLETESVKIFEVPGGFDLSLRLGQSVRTLCISRCDFHMGPVKVSALSKCRSLSVLELKLREGSESSLFDLLPLLPNISALGLVWSFPVPRRVRPLPRPLVNQVYFRRFCYRAAQPGWILRLIQNATSVVELCLYNTRISLNEVVSIVICMGARLQSFEISVADQDEAPCERVEAILRTMITCSPNLSRFRIGSEEVPISFPHDLVMTLEVSAEVAAVKREKLLRLLAGLKRRAPNLDTSTVKTWISLYCKSSDEYLDNELY